MEEKAIQFMSIEKLTCQPQVREYFDMESLTGLAQTIKETGILQPLLVRRSGSEFVVLEGERRLRAARMAQVAHVPVIIDDRELSEEEVVYRQLVVNCSREELEPIEKAKAIKRLMEVRKLPAAQAAVKLGMSSGTVTKLLRVLTLPESVQEQVATGALPLTTAYALSQSRDADSQRELATQAANGGLKRDEVVDRMKGRKAHRHSVSKRRNGSERRERVNVALGGGRSVVVAGPSVTLSAMIEWLTELVERLKGVQGRNVELGEALKLISSQAA